jgi:N-acylneuraminate cytidylyltransferase/CMP-N,N'-diacetyllegionaminic acid synthase
MKFLAVIPARGDSKGIRRKNLAMLGGKPLIMHTIDAAQASKKLSGAMLSTDDSEIAELGKKSGIDVPFLRPKELAGDATPMIDVLTHLMHELKKTGSAPDAIVLLQPTSPLRTAKHIDEAIALFESSKADTVVSVMEVPHQFSPKKLMRMNGDDLVAVDDALPRRQDVEKLMARNGPAVLITSAKTLEEGKLYGKKICGYVMTREESIDIDEPADLAFAEFLLTKKK